MEEQISPKNNRVLQVTPVRKDGWTKAKRKLFLDALTETCNVRRSVAAAGMTTTSAYMLRARDPAFADLWREALAMGYERLEELLLARALTGLNAITPGEEEADGAAELRCGDAPPVADGPVPPGGARIASGISAARGLPVDIQLAMYLVNRHRAVVEGRTPHHRGRRPATQEETDAALTKKLDMLERRLKAST